MLDSIKFVRGAVSDRDSVLPVLTHFCVKDERIQGANGRVNIDAPCPELKFSAVMPAEKFLRAVDACPKEPKFRFTPEGKLVIESKPFRAYLPHLPIESFPTVQPSTGKKTILGKGLVSVLRTMRPFVSDDASRQWASTILFVANMRKALACNNAMIAAMSHDVGFKEDIQLPIFAINELIRIGDDPAYYSKDDTSITFFWGGRWLRSQLIVAEYPVDTVKKWLDKKTKMAPLPKGLASSLQKILPFCDDPKFPVVHFTEKGISTAPGLMQAEIAGFNLGSGVFRIDNLEPMLRCSDAIALTPEAAVFSGPNGFRGVMAPLRR